MNKLDFYPNSPVQSDRWLWDDELPFTAFGQYGEGQLDMRVFEQGLWWVDVNGSEHLLSEMSTDYLSNVRKHLLTFGETFHVNYGLRYSIEYTLSMGPTPGMPEDMEGFCAYLDQKANPLDIPWELWLRSTVLFMTIESSYTEGPNKE